MLLCLPPDILSAIVSQLNLYETHTLASASKATASKVRSGGFFPKEVGQTLKLFQSADSVDDALARNILTISHHPDRLLALMHWIRAQNVGIDAGGFFTCHRERRIRIRLWDRALGVRHVHHHSGANYSTEGVVVLRRGFAKMRYDP